MKLGEDNAMPEYEDCKKLAQEQGFPEKSANGGVAGVWLAGMLKKTCFCSLSRR